MQFRNQRTLAGWLALALLLMAAAHAIDHGRGPGRVNIEHARGAPPQFVTNVNRADWPELALLPGIGPELARRIVASREQHGPYRTAEDLQRVRGIGPKTWAAIQPYIVCD